MKLIQSRKYQWGIRALGLLYFALLLTPRAGLCSDNVRIGLFSLLQPREISIRVLPGQTIDAEITGMDEGRGTINTKIAGYGGDIFKFKRMGNYIDMSIIESDRKSTSFRCTAITVIPSVIPVMEVTIPGKLKRYLRGILEIAIPAVSEHGVDQLYVVLETTIESAVASVVAAEMGNESHVNTVKALAVAVRTFMLSHRRRHSAVGFDFCDTTHCQFFAGEPTGSDRGKFELARSSTDATTGEYLAYKKQPVEAYYTAVCGGETVTPEMVWGKYDKQNYQYHQVKCRWCRNSKYAHWSRRAYAAIVLSALSYSVHVRFSNAAEITLEADKPGDFVRSVTIKDQGHHFIISTDEFRRAIGIRMGWNTVLSPTFSLERRREYFIFRGRGFGSQIGMCLEGAGAQARAGRLYHEILLYYFPGATIERHK